MTDTLTGRELDCAVATAMGWTDISDVPPAQGWWGWIDGYLTPVPTYSAADCSGLAAVIAWLTANAPTREQLAGMDLRPIGPARLRLTQTEDGWLAEYAAPYFGEGVSYLFDGATGPTIPATACRLLLAWAKMRAELEGQKS